MHTAFCTLLAPSQLEFAGVFKEHTRSKAQYLHIATFLLTALVQADYATGFATLIRVHYPLGLF